MEIMRMIMEITLTLTALLLIYTSRQTINTKKYFDVDKSEYRYIKSFKGLIEKLVEFSKNKKNIKYNKKCPTCGTQIKTMDYAPFKLISNDEKFKIVVMVNICDSCGKIDIYSAKNIFEGINLDNDNNISYDK